MSKNHKVESKYIQDGGEYV